MVVFKFQKKSMPRETPQYISKWLFKQVKILILREYKQLMLRPYTDHNWLLSIRAMTLSILEFFPVTIFIISSKAHKSNKLSFE